ncbi:hypothetical protein, partial [Streptomyces sp. KLOTTS4A1]|uniref:hypothetical protein n=1 Tax=Streptomyces sp. KLOTTS4A1 TaxID=3390996 RepID=UPI0039F5786E
RRQSTIDNWRYHATWKPLHTTTTPTTPATPATPAALTGRWLLAAPDGPDSDTSDWITHGLASSGAEVIRIGADADLSGYADADVAGVVSLLAIDDDTLDQGVAPGLAATLTLVQRLGDAGVEAPLWCLTQGAVSTGASDPLLSTAQAQV